MPDILTLLFGALAPILFFEGAAPYALALVMAAAFAFFALGTARSSDLKEVFLNTAVRTFGIAYVVLPLSYLVLLRNMESGGMWILFMLSVIWANDTFAMYAGKALGKHKLSPLVSPGKTVEGAIGGLAGGCIAAGLFNSYFSMGMGALEALTVSFVLGVIGISGDLFESVLKRAAGVKDSGAIVPGHGGVLDRIDSLIFPIPVLYYYLTLGRF